MEQKVLYGDWKGRPFRRVRRISLVSSRLVRFYPGFLQGGLMCSAHDSVSSGPGSTHWPGSLFYVLGKNTLLSKCTSPLGNIIGPD